uniref:Plastid light harvesting protein n=1 Tax=Heterosigma akashiwo TaxID=2829 RepID=A0A7S3Y2R7_HETAK
MKTVILATLIAGAAAFAPAQSGVRTTSLNAVPEADAQYTDDIGVVAPLGVWDPSGVLARGPEEVARLRELEIKHGRIAMLGVVGYLVTYAGVRFPGAEDIPSGFAALDNLPGMVWAQMIATWTMMEAANQDQYAGPWGTNQNALGESPAEFKGDFRNGFIDFGWDKLSDDQKMRKRAIELNQGRAAQMGILGLMVHEKLGNVDQLLPPHF